MNLISIYRLLLGAGIIMFSFSLPRSAYCVTKEYINTTLAFVEPDEGLVKSVYSKNIIRTGLNLGYSLDEKFTNFKEFGFHLRRYDSKISSLKAICDLMGARSAFVHYIPIESSGLEFVVNAGLDLYYWQSRFNDDINSIKRVHELTFGYDYGFGMAIIVYGQTLLGSIQKEHIYRKFLGNYNLDGHLYQIAWQLLI